MDDDNIEAFETGYDGEDCGDPGDPDCEHLHTIKIDGQTVCNDCGLCIEETLVDHDVYYYGTADTRFNKDPGRHNIRRNEDRSLYADLEPLSLPQEIVERANNYYKQIIENAIYRANNRKSIVFACLYHVYVDIGEPQPPMELARKFGLDKKADNNGLKIYSYMIRKRPNKKYIDALDMIPGMLVKLNLDTRVEKDCKEDISAIYNFVRGKNKTFTSSNPQYIAGGLLFYYLKLIDHPISRAEFSKGVGINDATFTGIAREAHAIIGGEKEIKF